jgi:hypothetical protein
MYRCISAYSLIPYWPCYYLYISIISCTCWVPTISVLNLAIFPLLLKPAAQKGMMDWNSSTRSSKLCIAPIAVPVMLWSLPLFCFAESRLCLQRHYLSNNYTLYYDIWLSVSTFGRMCGTIDPGSCIWWVLGFGIKIGYDSAAVIGKRIESYQSRWKRMVPLLRGIMYSVRHAELSSIQLTSVVHLSTLWPCIRNCNAPCYGNPN